MAGESESRRSASLRLEKESTGEMGRIGATGVSYDGETSDVIDSLADVIDKSDTQWRSTMLEWRKGLKLKRR